MLTGGYYTGDSTLTKINASKSPRYSLQLKLEPNIWL